MNLVRVKKLEVRLNWKIVLCIALGFSVFLKLGFWQLGRAEEKRQQISAVELRQSEAAITVNDLSIIDKINFEHRRVRLKGEFINGKNILIKRQLYQGRYGYEVLTPFRLGEEQPLLLLSRGWIEDATAMGKAVSIEVIEGPVEVLAELHFPGGQAFFSEGSLADRGWPLVLHRLNLSSLEPLLAQSIYPFIARLDEQSTGVYSRHWQSKIIKPATNISYAIQWFSMALMLLIVSLLASSNVISLLKNR